VQRLVSPSTSFQSLSLRHANRCRKCWWPISVVLKVHGNAMSEMSPQEFQSEQKCKPNNSKFCFHQVFLIQWSLWEPLFLYWHGKNSQNLIYNLASEHERNYKPWIFLMQPAVRACVQSSKRAETAKGSRHCNITEFFKKWHRERVLHHLQRAIMLEQEKKIVTKPLLEAETMLVMILLSSFFRQSMRNPSDFITARKPVTRELPDSTCYLHVIRKQQSPNP
jgi:hypothetical protein